MQSTSPSAVPLPVSPNASESELEALIDLLATDAPVRHAQGGALKKSEVPAHDLRDEVGRLDFSKIKALFSSNEINPQDSAAIPSRSDRGSIDVAPTQLTQAKATQVLAGSPLRTSGISPLVLSQPPTNIVDSLSFESGLPPVVAESTPVATALPLHCDNLDLIDLSSDHPPWASESNEAEASPSLIPASFHRSPPSSEKPITSLTASLALARQEVTTLRKRVQELEDLIHNSRDQLEHIPEFESGETFISPKAPCSENNRQELHADFRMQRGADGLKTPLTRMTDGIDQAQDLNTLSLAQARFALKSLLDDLGLPPSCIPSLLIEGHKVRTTPMSSFDEIHRAVDLVTFLDELVWRRSRMGAVYDNAYSEENVRALRNRLELWERTVRSRR